MRKLLGLAAIMLLWASASQAQTAATFAATPGGAGSVNFGGYTGSDSAFHAAINLCDNTTSTNCWKFNASGMPVGTQAEGTTADTAYAGSGAATIVAALKGIYNVATSPLPLNVNNVTTAAEMCGNHIFKHITTATDTQIVAPSGSTTVRVCDIGFSFGGTGNAYLESATSSSCGGTLTQIDMAWYGVANLSKTDAEPWYRGLNAGSSNGLCVHTTGAVSFDISVYYDQY